MGLDTIKANHRRDRRREFKQAIKPQFKPGPVTGSVVFTKKIKERLAHHANELFGDKGWAIGGVWLRDMTREQLLDRAQVERKSAKGTYKMLSSMRHWLNRSAPVSLFIRTGRPRLRRDYATKFGPIRKGKVPGLGNEILKTLTIAR